MIEPGLPEAFEARTLKEGRTGPRGDGKSGCDGGPPAPAEFPCGDCEERDRDGDECDSEQRPASRNGETSRGTEQADGEVPQ